MDQLAYARFVIGIAFTQVTVGDDAANGGGIVTQVVGQASEGGTFHFKIGDAVAVVAEGLEVRNHVRHRQTLTEYTALRSVESGSGDGDPEDRFVAETFDQ